MKPLIGITASTHREPPNRDWVVIPHDYFRAVQLAGGIPVLLPFISTEAEADAILNRIDGLLLSGGSDVDPQLYGEDPQPWLGAVSPERDAAELALTRAALKRDLPLLGICRGHQVLAVAVGGTLWQDIPKQLPKSIKHAQEAPRWFTGHRVTVKDGTRLQQILGSEILVNTYHHQAVKAVPAGWVESATAPDGINEALEHPGYRFVLSVQWHPENFAGRPYSFAPLFEAFIGASRTTIGGQ